MIYPRSKIGEAALQEQALVQVRIKARRGVEVALLLLALKSRMVEDTLVPSARMTNSKHPLDRDIWLTARALAADMSVEGTVIHMVMAMGLETLDRHLSTGP